MDREPMRKRRRREGNVAINTSDNFIDNLPNECVFHIFSFLPVEDRLRMTAVSRRLRNFGTEAWRDVKKLDIISLEGIDSPSMVTEDNNGSVIRIGDFPFKMNYPRLLSLCGRFLKDLTIPLPVGSDIIEDVTENCENLKKFRLRFEESPYRKIQCRDLLKLFAKTKGTLRHVVIDNMQDEFSNHADCLLELSEELIELQLWGFTAHNSFYGGEWSSTNLTRFIPALSRLKKLQILVLNGIRFDLDRWEIFENFEDLRHLEIYKSSGNGYAPFTDTIPSLRKLEYLSLECENLTNGPWFKQLVENNPGLKHLKLLRCQLNAESNKKLFELSNLETLRLGYLDDYQSLDLSGFYNLKKFSSPSVEDSAVIRLLEVASELEFIDLSTQGSISPRVLEKAHAVVDRRVNNIPLHIVIRGSVIEKWKRPENICRLLTVESSENFAERTGRGYKGYDVELFY